MRRRRRGYNYKFTEKKHSVRGIVAFSLAMLSMILGLVMIVISFQNKGNGSVYLGSGGVAALLIAITAFIVAVSSLREEGTYKWFPTIGTVLSVIAFGGWLAIYVVGFFI